MNVRARRLALVAALLLLVGCASSEISGELTDRLPEADELPTEALGTAWAGLEMEATSSTLRESYEGRRPSDVGVKSFGPTVLPSGPLLFGEIGLQLYKSASEERAQSFWMEYPPELIYINDAPGLPEMSDREATEVAQRQRLSLDSFPKGSWRATCLAGASIERGVCGAYFFWVRLCEYNLEILVSATPNDIVSESQAESFAQQTRDLVANRVGCSDTS